MDYLPTTLIISRRICNLLLFLVEFNHKTPFLDLGNQKAIELQQSKMKPSSRKDQSRRRNRPLSSPSSSPSKVKTSATLLDREETGLFSDLKTPGSSYDESNSEPRSFPYSVKQQCWDKAEKIKGRDPERWRRDSLGNIVFRKLVGCPGCLCHDYDHILPYSKGGKSTLDNCQVLQAKVNRSKGNKTDISRAELIQKSSYCRVAGRDMDLLELTAYGNVQRAPESSGCRMQ